MALAAGMHGRAGRRRAPVADGGEGTAEVFAGPWAANGVGPPATDPLGRPVGRGTRARGRERGRRGGRGDRPGAARGEQRRSDGRVEPRARRAPARGRAEAAGSILVGLGDTATVDGGAGLLEVVGDALAGRESRSSATCGPRCSGSEARRGVRAAEGRLAGAGRGARGAAGRDGPLAALRGASGSGRRRRARRRARLARRRSSSRVRSSSSSGSTSARRRPGRTSWSRARGRSTHERRRARRSEKCCAPAASWMSTARSSAAASRAAAGPSTHPLSGDPARAADDLVELGGRLAERCSASRRRLAIVWSIVQASFALSSTSGRNSHEVMP